ncbi:MAG: hypothetical protein K6V36_16125 [Anaerolineae bacterium]|nr:hypothetical protein [Anaerolineae bacterium]
MPNRPHHRRGQLLAAGLIVLATLLSLVLLVTPALGLDLGQNAPPEQLAPALPAGRGRPAFSAASNLQGIVLSLPEAGEFTIRETPRGQVLEAAGFDTRGGPGEPMLPVTATQLLVPPGIDWSSLQLELTGGHWVEVPGEFDLAPGRPVAADEPGGPVVGWGGKDPSVIRDGRDTQIYGQHAFYPAAAVRIVSRGAYRQWRVVTVTYSPFSYSPADRRLRRLEGGRAELRFRASPAPGPKALPQREKFWKRLQPALANPEATALYYPEDASAGKPAAAPAQAYSDYVIITTSAIVAGSSQLTSFVQAKQVAGHTVKVVVEGSVSDATHYLSGSNADTRANNIRAWLAGRYLAEGIDYVLLIGNPDPAAYSSAAYDPATSVPMKMCQRQHKPYPDQPDPYVDSPTDMFYSDLSGSWDPDGDGVYGEYAEVGVAGGIDRLAEVYVGRIPFYGSYTELDAILAKLIAYGQAEGDLSWRRKLLVAAAISNHGPQDNPSGGRYPEGWRTFGDDWGDALKSLADAAGFGSYTLYEKEGVYGDGTAYPLATCDAPLSTSSFVGAWQGRYGFVTWWGHGSLDAAYRRIWYTDTAPPSPYDRVTQYPSETRDTLFISGSHVSQLPNDSPSFVVQVSCNNGWPEGWYNLGYRLLAQGAIGTVSSSRVSWYYLGPWSPQGSADNASFGYYIFQRIVAGQPIGQALAACRGTLSLDGFDELWMNCTDFNLYGDPSLGLYSRNWSYRVYLPLCLRQ